MRFSAEGLGPPIIAVHLAALATATVTLACSTPAATPGDARSAPESSAAATPARSTDGSWIGRVRGEIAAREYEAGDNGRGLQAPNRAHDLRTYFDGAGVRVHARADSHGAELLSLSIAGVGRGEALTPLAPGAVVALGARVEIRRPEILEWYENSPAGLEQGFTLPRRPDGEGALVLALSVGSARASQRGERVILETAAGRSLEYAKLAAADAMGRALPVRFEVPGPARVHLVVEDRGALYPLAIDPLLTAVPDAQIESNQALAYLGYAVASAGDVNGDGYDDVIVGAHKYDAGQVDEGAAFVCLGSAAGIPDGNPITAATQIESDQMNAALGWSVAGAGDVNGDGYDDVIVGAWAYDAGEVDEGAAFIFLGSAAGIPDGNPLTAATQLESNQADATLGVSVAGAGDVNGDGYDDVIVGADWYDAGQTYEGAAFVFLGSASGIADASPATAAAQLESNQAYAGFGWSVASAGDVNGDGYGDVIAGAWAYNAGQSEEGAAFIFHGSATGIADGNPITAATQLDSNQPYAALGISVAGAGDVDGDGYDDVIVGAYQYDAGELDEGAAFVFHGSATGIADGNPATAAAWLEADQPEAKFGDSVAGAGDVNGDGYDDVIVGAWAYDAGQLDEGAAFVFVGSAAGIANGNPTTAAVQIESDQASATLGIRVAGAGDVDGDGYDDVIVGADWYDAGQEDEGAAFVYLGDVAVPEAGDLGLVAGAILLALLGRRHRACVGAPREAS
ncbi:MAG: integrin alpha [Myxococcales bacterium]|nr:integrin alpha [Myxococcales bacterium]